MRFLVDRCAGARLAAWLRSDGHDVTEARDLGADPGDRALLELAESEGRGQAEQNRPNREAMESLRQTMLARSSITKEDRDALSKFPTLPSIRNYQRWWLRSTVRGPKTDERDMDQ